MPTSNWYQMTWRIGLLVNLIPIDRDLVYGMVSPTEKFGRCQRLKSRYSARYARNSEADEIKRFKYSAVQGFQNLVRPVV